MSFINHEELHIEIQKILPEVRSLRHALHRHPEVRFQEHWTADHIAAQLKQSGVTVKRGYCRGTGITGEIGPENGPILALRADMDALELKEKTGADYASEIPGHMHACGHDGHMAMLLGVARILARHAARLRCKVRFIFQPGEEMGAGGRCMVEEGVLDGVSAVFGMHAWPDLPIGKVGLKTGHAMAGADWFRIHIQGKGCHAAAPDTGVDPIVIAAHVVLALQSIISREREPQETAVVSVCRLHAGSTENSIPENAEIAGTVRTFSPETREKIHAAILRIAARTAEAYRAQASVEYDSEKYVPLYNDPLMCAFVKQALQSGLGDNVYIDVGTPSMAAEDFAFYLQKVPGAFLWLGTGCSSDDTPPLHSPIFNFPDDALALGIGVWLSLVAAFNDRPDSWDIECDSGG